MLKSGKILKPIKILRAGKVKTFRWQPVAIYTALVVLAGVALVLWDRAYQAQQEALFKPPPPPVLAKNLVENIIGPGTVQKVSVDEKVGTLEMSVADVLIKPGQARAEKEKNLASEGTLAIQLLQSRLPQFKTMIVSVVKDGKVLATVRMGPGQKAPITLYSTDLK